MNGTDIQPVVIGLASAGSWGAGDFCGGLASRRTGVYSVTISSQIVGLLLMAFVAIVLHQPFPPPAHFVGGGLAGAVGVVGLLALYQALSTGKMGVAAPISAVVSAMVPVVVSAFTIGLPATTKLLGFALAIVSVWFIARTDSGEIHLADLKLPVVAGISFGLFYVIVNRVSGVSVLWPLVGARLTSLTLLILVSTLLRQQRLPAAEHWPLTGLCGVLDAGGNALYTLAAEIGRLDVAAVLASLYPAATILLARLILKEKISRVQWIGIGAVLVAIVLISV